MSPSNPKRKAPTKKSPAKRPSTSSRSAKKSSVDAKSGAAGAGDPPNPPPPPEGTSPGDDSELFSQVTTATRSFASIWDDSIRHWSEMTRRLTTGGHDGRAALSDTQRMFDRWNDAGQQALAIWSSFLGGAPTDRPKVPSRAVEPRQPARLVFHLELWDVDKPEDLKTDGLFDLADAGTQGATPLVPPGQVRIEPPTAGPGTIVTVTADVTGVATGTVLVGSLKAVSDGRSVRDFVDVVRSARPR